MRIDAKSGGNSVNLPPSSGGSRVKRVMYVIKRVDASATTDDLTLEIQHSADSNSWKTHTAAPVLADIEDLMTFESDAAVVLGEYYRAVVTTASSTTAWFVVDVFEGRGGAPVVTLPTATIERASPDGAQTSFVAVVVLRFSYAPPGASFTYLAQVIDPEGPSGERTWIDGTPPWNAARVAWDFFRDPTSILVTTP